jgi:integrase
VPFFSLKMSEIDPKPFLLLQVHDKERDTDFRFHDLRHCAATNMRRAGVDTATAMRIVGHKSEKMWKRYNAVEERDLVNAASKLNTYLQTNTVLTPAGSACIASSVTN